MALLVRAFPLRASTEDLRSFVSELQGALQPEVRKFYRDHGVTHESWYLQETPQGSLVIGLTQVSDVPKASMAFQKSQDQFPRWFKEQIMALSGVDPNETPEGPPTTLVYEWSDTPATRMQFAPPER